MACCKWTGCSPSFSCRNMPRPDMPESAHHPAALPALPMVYPLDEFYAQARIPLPAVERLSAEQLPEPYRALLAHANDMTPTLEKFHGATIHLEILRREQRDGYYFREVVL